MGGFFLVRGSFLTGNWTIFSRKKVQYFVIFWAWAEFFQFGILFLEVDRYFRPFYQDDHEFWLEIFPLIVMKGFQLVSSCVFEKFWEKMIRRVDRLSWFTHLWTAAVHSVLIASWSSCHEYHAGLDIAAFSWTLSIQLKVWCVCQVAMVFATRKLFP